ncbi:MULTISPECIES: LysR family transcriptional regulator [Pantoea]|jgi:DNA-binding transcriptional LysR family regulator|uniref:LysR family transcriptional regulator n=1 Tax=Pantoea anthophila TaxID=470931 RepID=A0ABY2Z8M5_9GAMM|nr:MULTISPECIES: LysR family transcriptional regulator [Pantoea]KAF6660436.1 LysR family transcriptional regulator [Enterobacteriaceae bacterium EKM102V]EIB96789.1 RuBisCO transcriptional regulator [Pantoea sp. Sc1]KAA5974185.1 LysR family transcriptional regulator [Pantoea sp. M_6]KAA5978123.1 LysR family transcriptional regulator [Pantoea sp. M_8]KAA5989691.1 LysR family transcriptional regulator [Pantoea sp. M_10]
MHDHRLKDILPFVASVECGSFTAAAERLHVTGSAVSKSLSRLETRLGSRLLERTTRSLQLTDAGSAYYQTCLRVLEDLAEAEAVLAAQRTIPSGRLRLAVPTTYGRLNVMPLLMPFCQQHPELALSLSLSDRFVDLFEEGVDVAVRIGGAPDLPASLGWRNMGREKMQFCASPAYLAREGRPEDEAALLNHPAILYERVDGSTKPWLFTTQDGQAHWREVPWRLAVGDVDAQLQAVIAGLGVAQMPSWLIQRAVDAGELDIILPELQPDGLTLSVVWPRRKQFLPKVDALLSALNELTIR